MAIVPLYPLMASRAGGRPVPVDSGERLGEPLGSDPPGGHLQPQRPDGAHLPADAIASIAASLPERVHLIVDEALVHFQDVEDLDA